MLLLDKRLLPKRATFSYGHTNCLSPNTSLTQQAPLHQNCRTFFNTPTTKSRVCNIPKLGLHKTIATELRPWRNGAKRSAGPVRLYSSPALSSSPVSESSTVSESPNSTPANTSALVEDEDEGAFRPYRQYFRRQFGGREANPSAAAMSIKLTAEERKQCYAILDADISQWKDLTETDIMKLIRCVEMGMKIEGHKIRYMVTLLERLKKLDKLTPENFHILARILCKADEGKEANCNRLTRKMAMIEAQLPNAHPDLRRFLEWEANCLDSKYREYRGASMVELVAQTYTEIVQERPAFLTSGFATYETLYKIISALANRDEVEAALAWYKIAEDINMPSENRPDHPMLKMFGRLGDLENVREWFEKCRQSRPVSILTLTVYCEALLRCKQLDEALEIFHHRLPEMGFFRGLESYAQFARTLCQAGYYEECLAMYKDQEENSPLLKDLMAVSYFFESAVLSGDRAIADATFKTLHSLGRYYLVEPDIFGRYGAKWQATESVQLGLDMMSFMMDLYSIPLHSELFYAILIRMCAPEEEANIIMHYKKIRSLKTSLPKPLMDEVLCKHLSLNALRTLIRHQRHVMFVRDVGTLIPFIKRVYDEVLRNPSTKMIDFEPWEYQTIMTTILSYPHEFRSFHVTEEELLFAYVDAFIRSPMEPFVQKDVRRICLRVIRHRPESPEREALLQKWYARFNNVLKFSTPSQRVKQST